MIKRPRLRCIIAFSALLTGIGLLGGCGQTGPLYLPAEPSATEASTTEPVATSESE